MDANRFRTHTLNDPRILRILAAALDSVEPGKIVREYLNKATLPLYKRVFLIGIGKAAEPMTYAAAESVGHFTDALIITKHASNRTSDPLHILESGHPIPDSRSLAAGEAALKFVSQLNKDDLLLCLISGGGSALVTAPRTGISLQGIQALTASLLASGATIDEINTIRRALDRVKGGGLARATKARVLSLILSDVLGNPLELIASGPTVQTQLQQEDVIRIAQKYDLSLPFKFMDTLPHLQTEFDNSIADRVQNIVIGDLSTAAQAAKTQAVQEGFHSEILDLQIQGEAREAGKKMAYVLRRATKEKPPPFCLIAGGETTVTIRGNGKGGRNQELALGAVDDLDGLQNVILITLATDGDDGPTDAAGAVINGETRQRAERLGIFAADYLSGNDAYRYFQQLDDLIKPGYSGTNVNDLLFLIGLQDL